MMEKTGVTQKVSTKNLTTSLLSEGPVGGGGSEKRWELA